jgi:DNA-binding beta-propeller fold protein YncE
LLYVCNQEEATISVIDIATPEVVGTIDLQELGFPPNAKPHHIAAEADGSYWYLSLIGASKVLKFTRGGKLVGQADFETPGMLGIHPTEDWLFVGRSMSAVNPPSRIGIIRRSDMSIEEVEVVFPRPHMLVVNPSGAFVHSASLGENQIMTVGVEDQDVSFTAVDGPHHVLAHGAISADGSRLVVSGEHTAKLLLFDATAAPALRLRGTLDVNARPWHLAFSPDQRFVYFGNQGANTVTVVNVDLWAVTAVVEGDGLAEPHGVVVSPDGRYVYVSNRNLKGEYQPRGASPARAAPVGSVVVINTNTHAIDKVIEVGRGPSGIAIIPAQ